MLSDCENSVGIHINLTANQTTVFASPALKSLERQEIGPKNLDWTFLSGWAPPSSRSLILV